MAFEIGKNSKIHPSAIINVEEGFIGEGAIINEGARIEGKKVQIGREAFIDRNATIGGGSCFDPGAFLQAGDWLHMGVASHLNTGRGIQVGHEFGCGIETKVFTHGAYIDAYNLGAPVQWEGVVIGNNVWLPNAWVNPGVMIGDNVVVAARSLINRDIPSGSLAGGIPVKILKSDFLPRALSEDEKLQLLENIVSQARNRLGGGLTVKITGSLITCHGCTFDVEKKTIQGDVTKENELLKDQLRRNGIRFRFQAKEGEWSPWK